MNRIEEIKRDIKDMKEALQKKIDKYYELESEISSFEYCVEILEEQLRKQLEKED